jgi:hypothetical protein
MTASGTFHQANEEQSDSSMMAWRVHEFGPPIRVTLGFASAHETKKIVR